MAEDTPTPDAPKGEPQKDAAYWEAEAKKAFSERDTVKRKLREIEPKAMSDEDRALFDKLKVDSEKSEEARKRKEGEFDAWRSDIVKKHDEALKTSQAEAQQARAELNQKLIGLEFASAASWFGEAGKTVLTPEIAEAFFGRFVEVQTDEQGGKRVVVKGTDGHVILDAKTGRPAAFGEAIGEVISALPNRERILRGSGKTGSGSSGGTAGSAPHGVDLNNLKASDFQDPKVREAIKRRQAEAGGMVFGSNFDRIAKP